MNLLKLSIFWIGALVSLWLAVMSRAMYRDSLEPEFFIGYTHFVIHHFWIAELALVIVFVILFQCQKKVLLAWIVSQILFCQFAVVSTVRHYIFWTAPTQYEIKK